MASTFNAFSSLLGSQEPSVIQNQLAKKKKNKKKPKKQGDDGQQESSTPEASVGKQSVSVPPSNGSASSGHNALLTVADAVRQVERAARQGNRGAERMTLWNSWITQVEQTAQGRGVTYRAPDGSEVDFKQMLIQSQALELTGESCIQHPLHGQTATELHALLHALLPSSCAALVPGLAEGIKCLGETLHGSRSDLELHATQTVRSILSALKTQGCLAAKPAASSAAKLRQLAQQAEEKLQHIRKLESQQGSGQSSLREQAATFAQIVDCYAGQLDVACSGTEQPAVAGLACEPLQALEAALTARLEQAAQGFRSTSAPSKDSAASTRSALEALDRQVSSAQGVMQQLEAQLASQRALLKGLQEQRQQLLRGQQQTDTSAGSRAAAHEAAATGEDADTCRLQMQVVRDLTELLRHGGLHLQEGAVKAATSLAKGDVPASYMQAIDQMLKTYLLYMEYLDTKYVTASLRLQRQKRLAELAAKSGKASEDDDKLLTKLCQDVDDIKLHSQQAMTEVHRIVGEMDGRWSTLHASVSAAELTDLRQNVDHFIGLLERKHQELMSHPAAMQLNQPPNLPPMAAPVHSFGSPAAEAGRGRPGKWTLDQVLQMDLSKHVDGQPLDPLPQNEAAEGKEGASPPMSRADVEAQIAMLQAQLGSMPKTGQAPAASTATTASTAAAAQAMAGNGLGQRAGSRRRT